MRKRFLMMLVALGLSLVGCEKQQTAPSQKSVVQKTNIPTKSLAEETSKSAVEGASPREVGASERRKKPSLKVPVQETKASPNGDEKSGELSKEECEGVCANAVSLSLKAEKNAQLKEQLEAFGLEDCQRQCMKKGTKVQAACMKKAQSLEDMAQCNF